MQGTNYVQCMNVVPLARRYAADVGETTYPGRSCRKTGFAKINTLFFPKEYNGSCIPGSLSPTKA